MFGAGYPAWKTRDFIAFILGKKRQEKFVILVTSIIIIIEGV
jgi:hypothetical protein